MVCRPQTTCHYHGNPTPWEIDLLRTLYRQRALIRAFAVREIATRYRQSALGWGWSLVQPLANLLVYTAVFTLVFRIVPPPLGSDPDKSSFAAFLFTGMVTFNVFSGLVVGSMAQLRSNGELLRKVHFPAWAPVIGASLVQFIQVILELVVLIALFLVLLNVSWTWILAIPILVAMALFAQGIGLILAILNTRFGDVQYMVTVALGALYFLTPILYPISVIEDSASWLKSIVMANPLSWFVLPMHDVMYSLRAPEWWVIPALLVFGATVFTIGFKVFERTSEDIGELL